MWTPSICLSDKKKRKKRLILGYLSICHSEAARETAWGGFLSRQQEKREDPGNEVIWHCFHFRFATQFGISGLI